MSKVGCDLIRISRIAGKIKREEFIKNIFSAREIELFEKRNFSAETVAGNFCGKEAYVKALGVGFGTIKPYEVEILRKSNGQPYGIYKEQEFSVSISHDGEYAFAVVVLD